MTGKQKRNRRRFAALESQDFTIRDEDGIFGHIRVKPSGIAWKAKNQHKYSQVSIEQFAEFADQEGRMVKS